MSRIGKQPVAIPANVKVKLDGATVKVEGPKGKLELTPHPKMKVVVDDAAKAVKVERPDDERQNRALHGLTRKLIANMVEGVTTGFEKRLIVVGVGYQARLDKKQIVLSVGYANQIRLSPPEGITVELGENPPIDGSPATKIIIRGIDKHRVGQFAADVRAVHKPEPYKGKGIRYDNETVRRKEGKSFASGG